MLKVKKLKGRNGWNIRRKISTEKVGVKAQDPKSIKLSYTVNWD